MAERTSELERALAAVQGRARDDDGEVRGGAQGDPAARGAEDRRAAGRARQRAPAARRRSSCAWPSSARAPAPCTRRRSPSTSSCSPGRRSRAGEREARPGRPRGRARRRPRSGSPTSRRRSRATTARLERAEQARASLEQEIAALRGRTSRHGRRARAVAGALQRERLDATRRRLAALDERLTGAIGMVPTIVVPDRPRAGARRATATAPRSASRSPATAAPAGPAKCRPAPRSHE